MPDSVNTNQSTVDSLKQEINSLRGQLESIIKTVEEKRHDMASDMAHKIANEIEHCRHKAAQRAGQLRDAGKEGLGEVEAQVRKNPLASLLIAFGAGWVISCMLRHLR